MSIISVFWSNIFEAIFASTLTVDEAKDIVYEHTAVLIDPIEISGVRSGTLSIDDWLDNLPADHQFRARRIDPARIERACNALAEHTLLPEPV